METAPEWPPEGRSEQHGGPVLSTSVVEERAWALVPGLNFLVHQARRDGLDTVSDILAGALDTVIRWIEEGQGDARSSAQDRH